MNIVRLFICLGALIMCLSSTVMAQDVLDKKAIEAQLNAQKSEIELVEPLFLEANLSAEQILNIRTALRSAHDEIQNIVVNIRPAHDVVKANITDLGPLPVATAEGEVALIEPESIKQLRAELTEKALMTEGLLKQAEALSAKSSRLLEKAASLRRDQFVEKLFEPQVSAFSKTLWVNATEAYGEQISNHGSPFQDRGTAQIGGLALASFLFLGLFLVGCWVSKKSLDVKLKNLKVGSLFSLISTSLVLPVVLSSVGLFFIYQTLHAQDIMTETNSLLVHKIFVLSIFFIFVNVATQRLAQAKIIRKSMRWVALFTVLLFVGDTVFLECGRVMGTPLELAIAQSYIITTIFAVLLGLFSFFIFKTSKTKETYFLPYQTFIVLLSISLLIIIANIFGYAALARYLFELIVMLFALFTLVLVIRAVIRPYLYRLDKVFTQDDETEDSKEKEHLVFFWLSLTLDAVLFFVCLPLVASVFGAEWHSIQGWVMQAFFGFKIGTMTLSIASIGIALFVFFILLFFTRMIQRVLGQKILPKTKMDESVRQSITQVLGYVGLIIALMAGISAVGFDLTNLALIAGALSVGIGFGLQSIVSNFVSGLILLFERPIKVGDWIITASGEGIVKEINVRATEIETFERTSIIVPNSELISSSVKNWTHKDKLGRTTVTVGVSYSSNPQEVRDILLKCVMDSKDVLNSPQPRVHFMDFADSALIFDVKFFMRNIQEIYNVETQIRFDMWDALQEAGIEISFPQQDLHIRSAEGLDYLKKQD